MPYCIHGVSLIWGWPWACHWRGNILFGIDAEQFAGAALQGVGLAAMVIPVFSSLGKLTWSRTTVAKPPTEPGICTAASRPAWFWQRPSTGHRRKLAPQPGVVLEQQRRQPPAHVPFHVIGQHEQKDTPVRLVYDGGWKDDLIVHDGSLAKGGFVEVPDKLGLGSFPQVPGQPCGRIDAS